jgi:hypothetical protein
MANILYCSQDRHKGTVQKGQLLNGATLNFLGIEASSMLTFGLPDSLCTDNITYRLASAAFCATHLWSPRAHEPAKDEHKPQAV